MFRRMLVALSLALTLILGTFGLSATSAPQAALQYAGPVLELAPQPIADLAEASIQLAVIQDVGAYSQGVGASACSYAQNWCFVGFSLHCPTTVRFTMYYWSGGYLTQVAQHYANWSGHSSLAMWAGASWRTDLIVVDDLGSGCLAGAWLIGIKW